MSVCATASTPGTQKPYLPGPRSTGRGLRHAKPRSRDRRVFFAAGAKVAALVCAAVLAGPAPTIAATLDADTTARLLAGLETRVPPLLDLPPDEMRAYARGASARWKEYERRIGAPMRQWAQAELEPAQGETIFYPFAGPDFATVQRLYPDAGRYVLVALQRAEPLPALAKADAADLSAFLGRFGEAWKQFAHMGFFRTLDLDEEAKKPGLRSGTSGRLVAFAARAGYRIVSMQPVRIDATGTDLEPHPGARSDPATWSSVRIVLERNGRRVDLDYVRLNLADASLHARPERRAWIERMAAHRTVLKAASHLLQNARFGVVRDALLAHAPSIVQDETGIEYSTLAERFDVRLYGRFSKPHSLFDSHAQRALAEAYQNRQDVKPLAFRVSYQRQPEANLQVAVRSGLMPVGHKR